MTGTSMKIWRRESEVEGAYEVEGREEREKWAKREEEEEVGEVEKEGEGRRVRKKAPARTGGGMVGPTKYLHAWNMLHRSIYYAWMSLLRIRYEKETGREDGVRRRFLSDPSKTRNHALVPTRT